jgi:hypothetical protein
MRRVLFLLVVLFSPLLAGRAARAQCPPPGCFAGGGPAATDCFVEWAGVPAAHTPCVDGSSCDADGIADGTCTFPIAGCINVPPCTGPLTSVTVKGRDAGSQALGAALTALPLGESTCTSAGFKLSTKPPALAGIKPGVSRFTVTAIDGGKRDRDVLKLTCEPAAPSLATDIQPIFDTKCATPACHVGTPASGNLNLEAGNALANTVSQPAVSTFAKHRVRVKPGSVKLSYLARKIMGKGLFPGDSVMPQACGALVPCLTDAEKYLILAWIQSGARP